MLHLYNLLPPQTVDCLPLHGLFVQGESIVMRAVHLGWAAAVDYLLRNDADFLKSGTNLVCVFCALALLTTHVEHFAFLQTTKRQARCMRHARLATPVLFAHYWRQVPAFKLKTATATLVRCSSTSASRFHTLSTLTHSRSMPTQP